MYICLMRHGNAEPFALGTADRSRELTAVGKKQAQAMIQTAQQWWPAGKTVLWSSPYVRACQTAVYFNGVIPYASFHTHEAIAEGTLERHKLAGIYLLSASPNNTLSGASIENTSAATCPRVFAMA